jgi:hypothetical protein
MRKLISLALFGLLLLLPCSNVSASGGDTTTDGTAASSGAATGYEVTKAFDDCAIYDSSDCMFRSTNTSDPWWISYDYSGTTAYVVNAYTIRSGWYSRSPNTWKFQGSNDNFASYDDLDSQTGISFGSDEKKSFAFSNTAAYQQYRLY